VEEQPTPEGKQRRKLDRQHLVQALRRDRGLFFEYARVPEQHKSGKFHEHWLAVTDYLNEDDLQDQWLKHTRGSSFNVKVQAVALRCPKCWPGRNADPSRKEKSRIVPPPGIGKCRNCGFEPDWVIPSWWEELADQAASELSKYLVKTAQSGITGAGDSQCRHPAGFRRRFYRRLATAVDRSPFVTPVVVQLAHQAHQPPQSVGACARRQMSGRSLPSRW